MNRYPRQGGLICPGKVVSWGMTERPCRSCGAPIIWLANRKTGKLAPIDVASKEKRIVVVEKPTATAEDTYFMADTYISHFANCPNAAQHRKG